MSDFSYMQFNGRGSVPLIGYYIAFRLPKSNFLRIDHNQKNVNYRVFVSRSFMKSPEALVESMIDKSSSTVSKIFETRKCNFTKDSDCNCKMCVYVRVCRFLCVCWCSGVNLV